MKTPWGPREALLPGPSLKSRLTLPLGLVAALLLLPAVAGCSLSSPDEGKAQVPSTSDQTVLAVATTTTLADSVVEQTTTTTTLPATTTTTLPATTTTEPPPPETTTEVPLSDTTVTTAASEELTTTTLVPGTTDAPETPGTTVPSGSTVLYEIDDWSSGLNGWAAAGQWKTIAGMLVTDGTDYSIAVAPVDLGEQRNYVVECEIQFVEPRVETSVYLMARLINGVGYWGGHNAEDGVNAIGYADTRIAGAYFTLDGEWHTYRFAVYDNTMKLYFEEAEVARAMSNRALEAGTVGIYCGGGQINVRSFRVLSL